MKIKLKDNEKVVRETDKQFAKRIAGYMKELDAGTTNMTIDETLSINPDFDVHIVITKKVKK